jgi:hypothetical protein
MCRCVDDKEFTVLKLEIMQRSAQWSWSVAAPLKEDIGDYSSMDYNVVHCCYYRMHWMHVLIVFNSANSLSLVWDTYAVVFDFHPALP